MGSLILGLIGLSTQTPKAGDIIIEYHPHSKKATRILSSEEFKASLSDDSEPTEPQDDKPWLPFRSREDFEFAELVNDATLTLGARGQLPSGSMLSTWRVLKQFA